MRQLTRYIYLHGWILLFSWFGTSNAQVVKATIEFQADTVAIGKTVPLRLEIEHPSDVVVVFPNKSTDFEPFELVGVEASPTKTTNHRSWDAVIYQVKTFDISPFQSVNLPYGYILGKDTLRKSIQSDSIKLMERIPELKDDLTFQLHNDIAIIKSPPNYTLWILIIAGIMILLVAMAYALRKPIERYLSLRRHEQNWLATLKEIQEMERLQDQTEMFDKLNIIWKSYLDPHHEMGLRSMTTTELQTAIKSFRQFSKFQQEELIEMSEIGDQVMYAGEEISRADVQRMILSLKQILAQVNKERKLELASLI